MMRNRRNRVSDNMIFLLYILELFGKDNEDFFIHFFSKKNKNRMRQESSSDERMEEDHFPVNDIAVINASQLVNSDSKSIHEKLNNYEKLDTGERFTTVKNIAIMLEELGNEGTLIIKPLLYQIMKDRENITKTLLNKIPDIVTYLEKHENFEEHLKNTIIPILIQFLNFNQLEMKEEAGKELGRLAHKLNDKDRGDFVLKHVIQMAHDDSNEDNRIVAVQLFSSMSECFGKQLCQQFIGLEILSLGDDTSVKVRKEAIKHLPVISKLVSKQFFNRFLDFFSEKSHDPTNWAIRKACIDIIIDIAELTTPNNKQNMLSDIMIMLLKDSNKWVRLSAYKNLGKFIYTLKGLKMNQKLFAEFCHMADNDINSIGKENQIIYSCAYNFPAVVNAIGRERWIQLYKLYEKLLKSNDKRIKITLSQSLHEIAKIIGEEYTEQYLFRVIDQFFKEKNDQIKLGIIKNLSEIMHVLSKEKRESLVGVFEEFQKDQKKWRIRLCIAKQLGRLLEIYSPQIIFEYLVPILLKFCSDSVSIVREEAGGKVGIFIDELSKSPDLQQGLIQSIKAFAVSPKYTQRQIFLIMCSKLINHKDLFVENFLDIFVDMQKDKVINVKLALAETVKRHLDEKGCISEEPKFVELLEALREDGQEDIRDIFQDC